MPPLLGSLDYLAEVAKDWARHRFATANRSDFTLAPSRFDLHRHGVRRRRVASGSAEAQSPLAVAEQTSSTDRMVPRRRHDDSDRHRDRDRRLRAGDRRGARRRRRRAARRSRLRRAGARSPSLPRAVPALIVTGDQDRARSTPKVWRTRNRLAAATAYSSSAALPTPASPFATNTPPRRSSSTPYSSRSSPSPSRARPSNPLPHPHRQMGTLPFPVEPAPSSKRTPVTNRQQTCRRGSRHHRSSKPSADRASPHADGAVTMINQSIQRIGIRPGASSRSPDRPTRCDQGLLPADPSRPPAGRQRRLDRPRRAELVLSQACPLPRAVPEPQRFPVSCHYEQLGELSLSASNTFAHGWRTSIDHGGGGLDVILFGRCAEWVTRSDYGRSMVGLRVDWDAEHGHKVPVRETWQA